MVLRSFVLFSVLGGAAALAADRAPVTQRFRIESQIEQEADLTALGQQKQVSQVGFVAFISVTLTDTTGGRVFHAVIDSMTVPPGSLIPAAGADSAKGAVYHGLLEPSGKLTNLALQQDRGSAGLLGPILEGFYPRSKSPIRAGAAWSDTTDRTQSGQGGDITVHTITNYTAGAGTQGATKVDAAFSSSLAGSQGMGSIEGTQTGTAVFLLGTDGRHLGLDLAATTALTFSGGGAPAPIPVTIKQTVSAKPIN